MSSSPRLELPHTLVITPKVLYFGTPVIVVSTSNEDGSTNLAPNSSAWALGDRIVLGLGDAGQTIRNLERERAAVLNVPDPELWPAVEALAATTGRRDVPDHKRALGFFYEGDKVGRAGLALVPSEIVRAPRLAACPLAFEVELLESYHRRLDGGPEGFVIAETRVLRLHAHARVVIPGTNHIDVERYSPLLYVFRHYFGAQGPLGKTFRA